MYTRWRSGDSVGLAIGNRGFNPSHCTVECHLAQLVHARTHTHLVSVTKQYNLVLA